MVFGLVLSLIISLGFVNKVSADPVDDTIDTCSTLTKSLKYKATDARTNGEVSILQDFLNTDDYFTGETTGFFNLATRTAVKKFQRANGLSADGSVGRITRTKLNELYGCGSDNPTNPTNPEVSTTPPYPMTTSNCTINSFSASPSIVTTGQSATLSWSTNNCKGVVLNGDEISGEILSPSGSKIIYPKSYNSSGAYDVKYSLSAVPSFGDGSTAVEKIITITVNPTNITTNPTVSISPSALNFTVQKGATPNTFPSNYVTFNVSPNQSVAWQSISNVPWLNISPSGTTQTSGTAIISLNSGAYSLLYPGSYTTEISFNFTGPEGTFIGPRVNVNLVVLPPIVATNCTIKYFTSAPSTITAGQYILTWSTSNCNSFSMSDSSSSDIKRYLTMSGYILVSPTIKTTYTITASPNAWGGDAITKSVTAE